MSRFEIVEDCRWYRVYQWHEGRRLLMYTSQSRELCEALVLRLGGA